MEQVGALTFLQPRHVYASNNGDGHIYLSAPLITFMARLNAIGVPVDSMSFVDENFGGEKGEVEAADCIGINLVGAPYIPEVIGIIKNRLRSGARVILGGQIIDKLSDDEFNRLFGRLRDDVVVDRNNRTSAQQFFSVGDLPRAEEVSSIPVWEQIPAEQMRAYLNREISFYLSQGCLFGCSFCPAAKGQKESYRNLDLAITDLKWLTQRAIKFGIKKLPIYLSNLDLFQSPQNLEKFLEEANQMAEDLGFIYEFRGLATVYSIMKVDPEYLERCCDYGLSEVGIGIDGATPHIWKRTKKVQNIPRGEQEGGEKCIAAIEKIYASGMTPEMLMVLGHDGGDIDSTIEDILIAQQFVCDARNRFNAKVHPYLVKSIIPGTDAWKEAGNRYLVEELIANPEYFRDLDFAAMPSRFSHPDDLIRRVVRAYYQDFLSSIDALDGIIVSSGDAQNMGVLFEETYFLNEGKFDR
jgi:hypothetical protein